MQCTNMICDCPVTLATHKSDCQSAVADTLELEKLKSKVLNTGAVLLRLPHLSKVARCKKTLHPLTHARLVWDLPRQSVQQYLLAAGSKRYT